MIFFFPRQDFCDRSPRGYISSNISRYSLPFNFLPLLNCSFKRVSDARPTFKWSVCRNPQDRTANRTSWFSCSAHVCFPPWCLMARRKFRWIHLVGVSFMTAGDIGPFLTSKIIIQDSFGFSRKPPYKSRFFGSYGNWWCPWDGTLNRQPHIHLT